MNTSTQLKAKVRNLSRAKHVQAEVILRNFMLERLLERLSISKYRNSFVLKGGLLIAAIVGIDSRSTMDMDFTVQELPMSEENLENMINEILSIQINDGVTMTLKKLEVIRTEADYPGFRLSIDARLDKTRQTMKVDITSGDRITREAIKFQYKLMLEERSISVLAYNLETVVAEKMETIFSRGITTTRMRDYYDIFILMKLHAAEWDQTLLKEAFSRTGKHRGTYRNIWPNLESILKVIEQSDELEQLWKRYQSKNEYASSVDWKDALLELSKVIDMIRNG
jgi:predicted nucleotidyltransferase component of viral defense system